LINLSTVWQCTDIDKAISYLHQAIDSQPNFALAYYNLSLLYKRKDQIDHAISAIIQAIKHCPNQTDYYELLGEYYFIVGKFFESLNMYQKAYHMTHEPAIAIKMAYIQPVIYDSEEDLLLSRSHFIECLSIMSKTKLSLMDPNDQIGLTSFFLSYQGFDNKKIHEQLSTFYIQSCPNLVYESPYLKPYQKGKRIHIGIISAFLKKHTIGLLNRGIIEHMSRDRFHVTLLQFKEKQDTFSESIQQVADKVVFLSNKLCECQQQIAQEALDILLYLDIGMESLTYFLGFSRLAPIQCVTWGHPDTTGIPNIDYYLSCTPMEPLNAEQHYSEKLVLLDSMIAYAMRPNPITHPTRKDIGLPEGYHIYACPQNLFKFHPKFDSILKEILINDPKGFIIIINGLYDHWTQCLIQRFSKTMPECCQRILFLPRMSLENYYHLLLQSDVILDIPFFSGGKTSLDALSLGAPIVTLPGNLMRQRITYGLYQQIGVMDLVAKDWQTYVHYANALAKDKQWRHHIVSKIKSNNDTLYENKHAIRSLESFFQSCVE